MIRRIWRIDPPMERGFTLLETVIVLMVLGIVTLLGLPMLNAALDETKVAGAASAVATALQYAQLTAVGSGKQTRVTFDKAAESILVERFDLNSIDLEDLLGSDTELDGGDVEDEVFVTMPHPLKPLEDFSIVFGGEDPFEGVDIVEALFGADDFVTFDALGTPSAGGTITLEYGNHQVVVTLNAPTGKVTMSN